MCTGSWTAKLRPKRRGRGVEDLRSYEHRRSSDPTLLTSSRGIYAFPHCKPSTQRTLLRKNREHSTPPFDQNMTRELHELCRILEQNQASQKGDVLAPPPSSASLPLSPPPPSPTPMRSVLFPPARSLRNGCPRTIVPAEHQVHRGSRDLFSPPPELPPSPPCPPHRSFPFSFVLFPFSFSRISALTAPHARNQRQEAFPGIQKPRRSSRPHRR